MEENKQIAPNGFVRSWCGISLNILQEKLVTKIRPDYSETEIYKPTNRQTCCTHIGAGVAVFDNIAGKFAVVDVVNDKFYEIEDPKYGYSQLLQ